MEVIVLTGPMASGKGEVVKYLTARGWQMVRFSDVVREEIVRQGLPEERASFRDVGNALRAAGGSGVLGLELAKKILGTSGEKFLCDGMRHPAEMEAIKKLIPEAKLLGITAPVEVLVERIMSRGRDIDVMRSREEIGQMILSEMEGVGESMQIGKCLEIADSVIENTRDLKYLYGEVDRFVV